MSTPDSSNVTHTSNADVITEGAMTTAHPSAAPDTTVSHSETSTHAVSSSSVTNQVNTDDAIIVTTGVRSSSPQTTTIEDVTKIAEKVKFIELNELKVTSNAPTKVIENNNSNQNVPSTSAVIETTTTVLPAASTTLIEIIDTSAFSSASSSAAQQSTENTFKTEEVTPSKNTVEMTLQPVSIIEKSDVEITSNHPAHLYSKTFTTTSGTTQDIKSYTTTISPPTVRPASLSPVQNMQPMTHHQSVLGTPRNVPSSVTHLNAHPPMIVTHTMTEGVPRNVPSTHAHVSVLQHPVVLTEGNPRNVGSGDIHRSAEDHVTSRRRQFLPASLRGLPPTPGVTRQHYHEIVRTETNTEPEEEEEDDDDSTTVDSLNSQTDEEIMEIEDRRIHSRRTSRPQQHVSQTRNLYPFLLNRMLG
jgi:hypothetical protein